MKSPIEEKLPEMKEVWFAGSDILEDTQLFLRRVADFMERAPTGDSTEASWKRAVLAKGLRYLAEPKRELSKKVYLVTYEVEPGMSGQAVESAFSTRALAEAHRSSLDYPHCYDVDEWTVDEPEP